MSGDFFKDVCNLIHAFTSGASIYPYKSIEIFLRDGWLRSRNVIFQEISWFQEILLEISCFQEILPCTKEWESTFRKFQSISGNIEHTESHLWRSLLCFHLQGVVISHTSWMFKNTLFFFQIEIFCFKSLLSKLFCFADCFRPSVPAWSTYRKPSRVWLSWMLS